MAKLFHIPVMAPQMAPPKRQYPITQRENIMRAARHEKPMWMPTITNSLQWPPLPMFADLPPDMSKDGEDWFGIKYKYEEAQLSSTAVTRLFSNIGEWREKLVFPDLDAIDWEAARTLYKRDEDKALAVRLGAGIFERLHFCEGFEQALCDILLEQDECKAFFDHLGAYKIEILNHISEVMHPDLINHNDDWSNARAPFFSEEVFKSTLFDSAVALADAVHANGSRYIVHCCGLMEAWLPYIVDDMKADILEIQTINDFSMILSKYGNRTTPIFSPDPYIMYDPDLKPEDARAYARSIVDQYGAHQWDGAGVIIKLIGSKPDAYYAFEEEIFTYSLECYKSLN